MTYRKITLLLLTFFSCTLLCFAQNTGRPPWWNDDWHFRLPVMVQSGPQPRQNAVAEYTLNFNELFSQIGEIGSAVDANSIRVVEVKRSGKIINEQPSQFDPDEDFDPLRRARGKLSWLLGEFPAKTARFFHIYFHTNLYGFKTKPAFNHLVVLESSNNDFMNAKTPFGWFTFETNGGVFTVFASSKVEDNKEGDWIKSTESHPQGLPIVQSPDFSPIFHPFHQSLKNTAGQWNVQSEIIANGPLKIAIRSSHTIASGTSQGEWEMLTEFLPSTIRSTILKGNKNGFALTTNITPGGNKIDENDRLCAASSDFPKRTGFKTQTEDQSPEWTYVIDEKRDNTFYAIHTHDDSMKDMVAESPQHQSWQLGWGRGVEANRVNPGMITYPSTFYFGFCEYSKHSKITQFIQSLQQPLSYFALPIEQKDK